MMMYMRALVLYLLISWITADPLNFTDMKPNSGKGSIFFRITGNVYPLGYYATTIIIGKPPNHKQYLLDIDTGSDLTWVTCAKINSGDVVTCGEKACTALGHLKTDTTHNNCKNDKTHACDYTVDYADRASSSGYLLRDLFPLLFRDGKRVNPPLVFGCGLSNQNSDPLHQSIKDGVLGLGKGEAGILHQLDEQGVIDNIVGHCLSAKGGGYMFFGDIPIFGIVWKQIDRSDQYYSLGSAQIMFGGHPTDIKDLHIIFDSGSTYTYLKSQSYEGLLDLITKNLNKDLQDAPQDNTLPVCWKGHTPFHSVDDVASKFPDLALKFTNVRNVEFHMKPNSYLIISKKGNVCLGILNGGEVGLEDTNLIGDISMHDKLVIYDNKHGKVGWADANCNVKTS